MQPLCFLVQIFSNFEIFYRHIARSTYRNEKYNYAHTMFVDVDQNIVFQTRNANPERELNGENVAENIA